MDNNDNIQNEDYNSIRLDSVPRLLSTFTEDTLNELAIKTVGDLFKASEAEDFKHMIMTNYNSKRYREIFGVIRLLKCKYLNEDPFYDINNEEKVDAGFFVDYGFTTTVSGRLARGGYNGKKLYDLIHSPGVVEELEKVNALGPALIHEIIYKGSIIADYYDKKAELFNSFNDDDLIKALGDEIVRIQNEIQELNARTNDILKIIQEKLNEKEEGYSR